MINNILGKIIASSFKEAHHDISVYLQYYEIDEKSKEKVFEREEAKGKILFICLLYKILIKNYRRCIDYVRSTSLN